ncbi:hypothetical protein CSKR_202061 [Clonorchis sinensis]|uniref:Uncharacterized protein n=1 Tax=Clonorchis sinensis TaxID=79923 RepID=A0A8T1LWB4_CLOSI|nr:hypothetical protein CSKR_202061 [Clonorchis sinensis]
MILFDSTYRMSRQRPVEEKDLSAHPHHSCLNGYSPVRAQLFSRVHTKWGSTDPRNALIGAQQQSVLLTLPGFELQISNLKGECVQSESGHRSVEHQLDLRIHI